jgi:DnaJ-class molecular chaperone
MKDEITLCSSCDGSGEGIYDGSRCHACNGTGINDPERDRQRDLADERRYDEWKDQQEDEK